MTSAHAPSLSVREALWLYPRGTAVVLGVIAAISAAGFAMFSLGPVEVILGTLSQVSFALGCKLIFFQMRRFQRNRGFASGDGKHVAAIFALAALGAILGAGPATKIHEACPTCFQDDGSL